MIIKIFAKTDIPFLLQGIRRGPLLESDCSSFYCGLVVKEGMFSKAVLFLALVVICSVERTD